MLQAIGSDLWVAEQPLRFLGLEVGARMTVVRLPGGKLLVHSPIAWTKSLDAELEELGTPAVLVAPNRFHHLFARSWQSAHPSARLYVAPGLDRRRPDLAIAGILGERPSAEWSEGLEQVRVEGFPMANEVVFFHGPSRALIASDLVFNIGSASPPLTRIAFRMMGAYGRPATTPMERLLIRDRAAFRRSLERILAWPIERLVVAHGAIVRTGGHAALAAAYAWLLERDSGRSR
jgi:hypothetical protein